MFLVPLCVWKFSKINRITYTHTQTRIQMQSPIKSVKTMIKTSQLFFVFAIRTDANVIVFVWFPQNQWPSMGIVTFVMWKWSAQKRSCNPWPITGFQTIRKDKEDVSFLGLLLLDEIDDDAITNVSKQKKNVQFNGAAFVVMETPHNDKVSFHILNLVLLLLFFILFKHIESHFTSGLIQTNLSESRFSSAEPHLSSSDPNFSTHKSEVKINGKNFVVHLLDRIEISGHHCCKRCSCCWLFAHRLLSCLVPGLYHCVLLSIMDVP